MPWAGGVFTQTNGVYTGSTIWNNDKTAGTLITAAHHDTHDYDIAQGINNCVAKDGQNTVTILNLSGTVNASSGIIKVGSIVLASTYGTNNAFYGGAGNFTTTGSGNVASGNTALVALTSGLNNAVFGNSAANALTTGSYNCSIGNASMLTATTATQNVAVGGASCHILTTGSDNVALGYNSLSLATTGSDNVALGSGAATGISTGSQNVGIGYQVQVADGTATGQLTIQNAIYGVSNTAVSSSVSSGNIGLYTKAPTARLHLPAGTSAGNTAPLKLTAGTNLGTPEDGAIEFDGTHLYITISGVRTQIV